jgi:hypothetical protein
VAGAARGAGEGGADVRADGEGAAAHDGGRRGAVHGAVAGAAGAQPGGGRAQGALREGPQDRRRDQLPREHCTYRARVRFCTFVTTEHIDNLGSAGCRSEDATRSAPGCATR